MWPPTEMELLQLRVGLPHSLAASWLPCKDGDAVKKTGLLEDDDDNDDLKKIKRNGTELILGNKKNQH